MDSCRFNYLQPILVGLNSEGSCICSTLGLRSTRIGDNDLSRIDYGLDVVASENDMKLDDLHKAIDAVNTSATALQGRYQEVGVMTLEHLDAHGDVGPLNRLVMGMPAGTRRQAMATWMLKYGAVKVNQDKDTKQGMALSFDKTKVTNVAASKEEAWHATMPVREISEVFDLQVAFKSLLNRCKGKTLLVGGVPHKEQAETALKAMAAAIGVPYDDGKVKPINGVAKPISGDGMTDAVAAVAAKQVASAAALSAAADAMATAAVAATIAAKPAPVPGAARKTAKAK